MLDSRKQKKILIICCRFFPSYSPRALRATELAIELSKQGHNVTIYAVLGKYNYLKFEEEHRLKVKNIGKMKFATLNSDGWQRRNIIDRLLFKLLNRLLEFPDIEFMAKIPKIIRSEKNVDLLISIANPFPIHWGCALSKSLYNYDFPKTWVADCGDPYMFNKFQKHPFYFKYFEKWFSKNADFITVPSANIVSAYYMEFREKIKIIPQGFNFNNMPKFDNYVKNSIPTFAYAGTFYKNFRDPSMFLNYLCSVKTDFKFVVYTMDIELILPFTDKLGNKLEIRSYVSRDQLLTQLSTMDFLLHIQNLNDYGSPSKLIDYALVKRPILKIASDFLPVDEINEFLEGNYKNQYLIQNLDTFNITTVAQKFLSLIK